jgi:hypothetical protein
MCYTCLLTFRSSIPPPPSRWQSGSGGCWNRGSQWTGNTQVHLPIITDTVPTKSNLSFIQHIRSNRWETTIWQQPTCPLSKTLSNVSAGCYQNTRPLAHHPGKSNFQASVASLVCATTCTLDKCVFHQDADQGMQLSCVSPTLGEVSSGRTQQWPQLQDIVQ